MHSYVRFDCLGLVLLALFFARCTSPGSGSDVDTHAARSGVMLQVLGTIQDAGSPHAACQRKCCAALFTNPDPRRKVTCLGVVDYNDSTTWLFEATPDMTEQMKMLTSSVPTEVPNGVFLTHAHIGHYAGLMYFGKEAMGANHVPVYAMPRMAEFLSSHGPWSQLVTLGNIELRVLEADEWCPVNEQLSVMPIRVPHRDEFSETVGYLIQGPSKRVLFVPDIDKWEQWSDRDILSLIKEVDYAFLDATFYDGEELGNRDMSQIPHPSIAESMELFAALDAADRAKVHFIHLNHTNPALDSSSQAYREIKRRGFALAVFGAEFDL